jgi:hypothetical protein
MCLAVARTGHASTEPVAAIGNLFYAQTVIIEPVTPRVNEMTAIKLNPRRLLVCLVAATAVAAQADWAAAEGVPTLDVEPSCRAAADAAAMGALAGANTRDLASCMRDETEARDSLSKEWAQFSGQDQQRCVSETKTGGTPSYVELLVCLEMMRDASGQDPLPVGPSVDPRRRK